MKATYSDKRRGFRDITIRPSLDPFRIGESSAIRDYDDALDNPGSSCLWIGMPGHESHCDRENVAAIIAILEWWLDEGRLPDAEQLAGIDGIEVAQ